MSENDDIYKGIMVVPFPDGVVWSASVLYRIGMNIPELIPIHEREIVFEVLTIEKIDGSDDLKFSWRLSEPKEEGSCVLKKGDHMTVVEP